MLSHQLCNQQPSMFYAAAETFGSSVDWKQARLSSACEVVPVVERIISQMTALGYPARDVYGMRLAIEEAILNGLRHGNRSDPTKRVRVRYSVRPERALVQVQDQGDGFDPEGVPDPTVLENLEKPSGRGLLLLEHYTTWARYNRRGNRVTLCKCPSGTLSSSSL